MEIHYKQTTIPYWSTIRVSSVINDDDLNSKFQNLIYLISWASSLTVKAYEQVPILFFRIFINSLSFNYMGTYPFLHLYTSLLIFLGLHFQSPLCGWFESRIVQHSIFLWHSHILWLGQSSIGLYSSCNISSVHIHLQ